MTGFAKALRRASFILALLAAPLGLSAQAAPASDYVALEQLFTDWRNFEHPSVTAGVPDYTAAAMQAKAAGLAALQSRLHAIDPSGWPKAQQVDYKLVQAELNGLDFDLRVRKPWALNPAFYATVFDEQSDVPVHEGPSAYPNIDLYDYAYPLSKADQKTLTTLIGAIPALLDQAKVNLKDANARDLWVYSVRALRGQSQALADLEAGKLNMRTLPGHRRGGLDGAGPELRAAVAKARAATDRFVAWVEAEAPTKTGPSGVGKENYTWYEKNVHLVPYSWDEQVTLLRRELERAHAGLALEEFNNRALPPQDPVIDAKTFRAFTDARMAKMTDFLIQGGLVPDKDYFRKALWEQRLEYAPPAERDFFGQTLHREPLGLYSHQYHWIELARLKYEPNASLIRRGPSLFNMYDARSEGLATAMEELLMHAGLYNDDPRGREIVWIMAANRAARGLASLYVQANEMNLQQAGQFHAEWTPRGWSDPNSKLVGFEQSLYLSQPGYGSSYITGKLLFDRLIAESAHQQEKNGKPFSLPAFFANFNAAGVIPFTLIEDQMIETPIPLGGNNR